MRFSTRMVAHGGQLTGIRGFAVLLVVCKWFPMYDATLFSAAAHWEDTALHLFFLLSGFLIGRLHGNLPFTCHNALNFLVLRASRVLPLFYLVLISNAAVHKFPWRFPALAQTPSRFYIGSCKPPLAAFVFCANPSCGHLWSVAVEVHFYFMFIIVWFIRSTASLSYTWLIYATMQYFVVIYSVAPIGSWTFLHIFLVGSSVGIQWDPKKVSDWLSTKPTRVLSALSFMYVMVSSTVKQYIQFSFIGTRGPPSLQQVALAEYYWRADDSFANLKLIFIKFYYMYYFDPVMLLACCFMILCAAIDFPATNIFATPLLLALGECAYSLYVVHPFVYRAAGTFANVFHLQVWAEGLLYVCSILLSIAVAFVSYHYVEFKLRVHMLRSCNRFHKREIM